MADMKKANEELFDRAVRSGIKFPSLLDEAKRKQKCGQILLLHRTETGFDLDAAFKELEGQFGVDKPASAKKAPKEEDEEEYEAGDGETKKKKKPKRKAEADAEEPGSPSKVNRQTNEKLSSVKSFICKPTNKQNITHTHTHNALSL